MITSLPKAVVFDWDNTLVNSWDAIMAAINGTFRDFGMPEWTMDEVRQNCRRSARDSFPEWFGKDWEEAYRLFYVHFDKARTTCSAKASSGAADLLGWFKAQGIPAFVVSNKRGDYLRQEAETLKWNKFFVALIGSGDAANDKPARDPVDMGLEQIGLAAGPDIWFVGDTDVDVQCARNAGCTPVFVGDAAEARKLSIDAAYADCAELHARLNERGPG